MGGLKKHLDGLRILVPIGQSIYQYKPLEFRKVNDSMCYVGEMFSDGESKQKMCHTRTGADQLFLSTVQIDMSMPPIG